MPSKDSDEKVVEGEAEEIAFTVEEQEEVQED